MWQKATGMAKAKAEEGDGGMRNGVLEPLSSYPLPAEQWGEEEDALEDPARRALPYQKWRLMIRAQLLIGTGVLSGKWYRI